MTINDYLTHPMGKGNAAFLIGQAKSEMIGRFLLDEDAMKVQVYDTRKTLVFHFELPSKSSKGIEYDVVLEFPYNESDFNTAKNIFNFPFKVYSNCPSFVYTYAYVFNQHGLLIDWLKSRYDHKTLRMAPATRNKLGVIFYEHSIFNAVYYIFKNIGTPVSNLVKSAKKASVGQLRQMITPQSDIETNSKIVKAAEREMKKIEKAHQAPVGERNDLINQAHKENRFPTHTTPITAKSATKPKGVRGAKGTSKPKRPR